MKQALRILAAVAITGISVTAGVIPYSAERRVDVNAPVAASESAALFVGVRDFVYDDTLTEVKYGVDDAVDLAYVLAIERTPQLVDPKRIVLALSGDPQKPQSQRNLDALIGAGATRRPAAQSDVLTLLEQQARAVGRNGVLIVAFATHGINHEGTQYLLTASSLLQHRETGVTETKIREIVSQARVARALILIDACRQSLTSDTRNGKPDPRSAAALLRALGDVHGLSVFSAAAPGQYAYDDEARRNGVFTAAVIEGLQCRAATDDRGYVTIDTLRDYVEQQVLSWVQKHRDPNAKQATQLQSEGRSSTMPLAVCGRASQ
ncbi:MAG: caspase domain-containing protein [Thermoanaerobaculia bacterium]